ncbi:helix-turn-helix transcriptional regulator [Enterococcus sp. BWM-S5]|uniref:Helix-turn-helix transcriptional regulator n=1 Tax=Enterococcus larvae TaxID=2794352 RepID=A0ABS4CJ75_9ENTE|nr:helix-turn-helix transcriptional regulator [Enterococcus larvae]
MGIRLKEKRLKHHLTQEQLAEKIYVSRQTISGWENGKNQPDLENLIMLSELYKTTLDELLKGESVEMTTQQPMVPKPKPAPTRKFAFLLFYWSLLSIVLQIILREEKISFMIFYAIGGFLITAFSLKRTNRLSNLYSQGVNMFDPGIYLCLGFLVLIIVGFILQDAIIQR